MQAFLRWHEQDPEALCTLAEIAVARALLVDFLNRYFESWDNLIAWHRSVRRGTDETPVPRPTRILDISDAFRMLDAISRMCERRERADSRNAISRDEFTRVVSEMGRIVALHVDDEETRRNISEGWTRIQAA